MEEFEIDNIVRYEILKSLSPTWPDVQTISKARIGSSALLLRVPPKGIRSFTPEFWLDVFVMPSMSVSKLRELFPSFGFVM
jgi:hypothetical protein